MAIGPLSWPLLLQSARRHFSLFFMLFFFLYQIIYMICIYSYKRYILFRSF